MDGAVIGILSGTISLAIGVVGTSFAMGGNYRGIKDDAKATSKRQDKLEQDIKDCQANTGTQFKKCQDDEIKRMDDLTTLLNTHTITMTTLTAGLATLTATLSSLPTQKELTTIVDRLSHIEGVRNGKEK